MTTKRFNGKAIYQPSGKAAEYSPWACNFYTGCSNDCEYCYCKCGVMSHVWSTEPRLKKCFKNEHHALEVFKNELIKARLDHASIKERGILFSFTTDPMLPETFELTLRAVVLAVITGVPVKILTKRADWLDTQMWASMEPLFLGHKDKIAFGFTLTGFDDKEPGASTNQKRIEAMRELHDMGFKTFASIEPVIDPVLSIRMIHSTKDFCDLFKVGLISGKCRGFYDNCHLSVFWNGLIDLTEEGYKIYPKDSLLEYMQEDRSSLDGYFVSVDYNIFQ